MQQPSIKSKFVKLDPEVGALRGPDVAGTVAFITRRTGSLVLDIKKNFFSGRPGLNQRSGKSADQWDFNVRAGSNQYGMVGESTITSNLPADFQKAKTIRARNGKYLAIPLSPVLKPDGTKKFEGPRSSRVPKNIRVFKSKNGRLFLGPTAMERGRYRLTGAPWWKLQKSVKLPAYTKGLDSYILRGMDRIGDEVSTHLVRFFGR